MFLFRLRDSERFYLTLKLIVPIMSASCPWSQSLGSLQFWHLGKSQILSFLKPRYNPHPFPSNNFSFFRGMVQLHVSCHYSPFLLHFICYVPLIQFTALMKHLPIPPSPRLFIAWHDILTKTGSKLVQYSCKQLAVYLPYSSSAFLQLKIRNISE